MLEKPKQNEYLSKNYTDKISLWDMVHMNKEKQINYFEKNKIPFTGYSLSGRELKKKYGKDISLSNLPPYGEFGDKVYFSGRQHIVVQNAHYYNGNIENRSVLLVPEKYFIDKEVSGIRFKINKELRGRLNF